MIVCGGNWTAPKYHQHTVLILKLMNQERRSIDKGKEWDEEEYTKQTHCLSVILNALNWTWDVRRIKDRQRKKNARSRENNQPLHACSGKNTAQTIDEAKEWHTDAFECYTSAVREIEMKNNRLLKEEKNSTTTTKVIIKRLSSGDIWSALLAWKKSILVLFQMKECQQTIDERREHTKKMKTTN